MRRLVRRVLLLRSMILERCNFKGIISREAMVRRLNGGILAIDRNF
jgi:hypothetical protein